MLIRIVRMRLHGLGLSACGTVFVIIVHQNVMSAALERKYRGATPDR